MEYKTILISIIIMFILWIGYKLGKKEGEQDGFFEGRLFELNSNSNKLLWDRYLELKIEQTILERLKKKKNG